MVRHRHSQGGQRTRNPGSHRLVRLTEEPGDVLGGPVVEVAQHDQSPLILVEVGEALGFVETLQKRKFASDSVFRVVETFEVEPPSLETPGVDDPSMSDREDERPELGHSPVESIDHLRHRLQHDSDHIIRIGVTQAPRIVIDPTDHVVNE